MKITIKGTNLELSDSIYQYTYNKINELEKFVQNVGEESDIGQPPIECWVEVGMVTKGQRSGDIFRAEAQIKLPGASGIRAEAEEWDLHVAIDRVKDELQRQLKRYKNKRTAKQRRGARRAKNETRFSESL